MRATVMFKFHVPGVGAAIYSAAADEALFDAITRASATYVTQPVRDRRDVPVFLREDYDLGRPIRSLGSRAFDPGGLVRLLEMCENPVMDVDSQFLSGAYAGKRLGQFLFQFLGISFVNLTERRISCIDRIGAGIVRLLDNIVRPKPICPMVWAR